MHVATIPNQDVFCWEGKTWLSQKSGSDSLNLVLHGELHSFLSTIQIISVCAHGQNWKEKAVSDLVSNLVVPIHYPDTPCMVYPDWVILQVNVGTMDGSGTWGTMSILPRREFGISQMASVIWSSRVTLQLCILRSSPQDEDNGMVDGCWFPGQVASLRDGETPCFTPTIFGDSWKANHDLSLPSGNPWLATPVDGDPPRYASLPRGDPCGLGMVASIASWTCWTLWLILAMFKHVDDADANIGNAYNGITTLPVIEQWFTQMMIPPLPWQYQHWQWWSDCVHIIPHSLGRLDFISHHESWLSPIRIMNCSCGFIRLTVNINNIQ